MAAPVRALVAAEAADAGAEAAAPDEAGREAPVAPAAPAAADGVTEPTVVAPAGVLEAEATATVAPPEPTVWAAPAADRHEVDDEFWTVTWAAYCKGQRPSRRDERTLTAPELSLI